MSMINDYPGGSNLLSRNPDARRRDGWNEPAYFSGARSPGSGAVRLSGAAAAGWMS